MDRVPGVSYMRSWKFWLVCSLLAIFIIWLFFGGKKHQFVGMAPLDVNYDLRQLDQATLYCLHPTRTSPVPPPPPKEELEETSIQELEKYCSNPRTSSETPPKVRSRLVIRAQPRRLSSISASNRTVSSPRPKLPVPTDDPEVAVVNVTPVVPVEILTAPQPKKNLDTLADRERRRRAVQEGKHGSEVEAYCADILEDIYGVPFTMERPSFLRNPETNRCLEIDCYNEELKLGLEYNGPTHYKWPNHTPMTKAEFIAQVRRDQYKVEACDRNGVYLITVPHNVPRNKLRAFIEYYLPETVQERLNSDTPQLELRSYSLL